PTIRMNRNDGAPAGRKNVDPFPLRVIVLTGLSITGRAVPPSKSSIAELNVYVELGNRLITSNSAESVFAVLKNPMTSATAAALFVAGLTAAVNTRVIGGGGTGDHPG